MRTKVLLGEDNLVTQQVLKAMLESRNCDVTTASTFEEILSQLQNNTFSFLLLDYHLDQDADFVLSKIRSLANSSSTIPVHIMSAGRREDMMEMLNAFKVDGFLKKPIENDQLDTLLSDVNIATAPSTNDQYLRSIIGDNKDRIETITDFFLAEVPPALVAIAQLLQKRDYVAVKKLVHRIRPAYTYLGKDDLQVKMGEWEDDLLQEKNRHNYENILREINHETENLILTFPKNHPIKTESTTGQIPLAHPKLHGLSILIVDDNQVILSVFSSLLQSHKMDVRTAKNGAEGVLETVNNNPDLILMDLHMPGIDGVEAISTIRKKRITTPIIAISNATTQKEEALIAGANNFLLKPVDATDLLNAIVTSLNI